ncbi:uncharacterized protein O3C94_014213 [Discoglossus pictus]
MNEEFTSFTIGSINFSDTYICTKGNYAVSCIQCISRNSASCTGPSVTCPYDHICASAYTVTTTGGGKTSEVFSKSCVPQNKCYITGSYTISNSKVKMATSCCVTDNCTPPSPELPSDNSIPNGRACRSCVSSSSGVCDTGYTIQCTGDERFCFLQSSQSGINYGCASKSICDTQDLQGVPANVTMLCTSGGASLCGDLLFPHVFALLLMIYFPSNKCNF